MHRHRPNPEMRSERHGRHGHRGWGRRRVFDHGELRPVMLKLIADKPRHGYELIKEIEDRVGGAYSPSPGVVYPSLAMLEELGHIAADSDEGDTKKRYAATPAGLAWLADNKEAVDAIFARMDQAGATLGPSPAIVRAMENLKVALRLRMEQGPLSDDETRRIAAAIDGAATAVERS
jgi:DNA-binding PadR family transcriptional regulator